MVTEQKTHFCEGYDCPGCPFGGPQVFGEGSRILQSVDEWRENKGVKYRHIEQVRDNLGQYDVVVVGMAPARNEVRDKRVFTGDSGQMLRGFMTQLGISEYYICNVLLCPILDEKLQHLAVKSCRERVVQEVLERHPKLIICLGDMPLRVFCDIDYNITEIEGRIIPSKVGVPVLPIRHPAYYLRNPYEAMDFIESLKSAKRWLSGNYEQAGPTKPVLVVEDLDASWVKTIDPNNEIEKIRLPEVLEILDKADKVAVDTETTGLYPYGKDPNRILEMGLAVDFQTCYVVPYHLINKFKILEKKKCVFWNAAFDVAFIKQHGITPYIYFDGMIAHHVLDERPKGHGLKRVAKLYLGAGDWEADIHKYLPKKKSEITSYEIVPPKARWQYLSGDACYTLQLEKVLSAEIGDSKLFWNILMPAARMFAEIRQRGMPIDEEKLNNLYPRLEEELEKLQDFITKKLRGNWLNPNSPRDMKFLIYEVLQIPVDPFYGPTTSKEFLKNYEYIDIIDAILRYRELHKLKGTYVEGLMKFIDYNGRIHPNINLTNSETGRLSSDDPSIMNLKRERIIKELFIPEPDMYFGYGDIKGGELRWYCIRSRDQKLIQVLREGGDPHNDVSTVAFGPEQALARRTEAKTVVFGRMYGRGRKAIEAQVGSAIVDDLIVAVDSIFPEIRKYRDLIENELKKGYIESWFGRRRRFPLITADIKDSVLREAVNAPIQADSSDLMLSCFLYLWDKREETGVYPFWPVHDSITSHIPDPRILPELGRDLERYSEEISGGIVPFVWDMDWGINYAMDKVDIPGLDIEVVKK